MSTGLQAILANPAALASLQNTMGPATVQTQGEAEMERARAQLDQALAQLGIRASAASGEANQAAQAYGAAAAAPMPQVDPLEALVNRIGSRTASVLSGDKSYAEGGEKRLGDMHADLVRSRVDNLTALKDQWAMKAQAAKELGNLEEELKGRAQVEKFSKTIDGLLQAQRDAAEGERNTADNKAAMERVQEQGRTAIEVARINAAARGSGTSDADALLEDFTSDYTDSHGNPVKYLNQNKVPGIKDRNASVAAARRSGVPVLTQKQEDGLHLLEEAFGNISGISNMAIGVEDPATGAVEGGFLAEKPIDLKRLTNWFEAKVQTNPQIAAFPAYRTAAINIIQSLASLGPGLRINQAEINAALKYDIPNIGDTRATAKQKLKNLRQMLEHVEDSLLGRGMQQGSQPKPAKARRPNATEFDDEVNEVLGN